MKPFAFSLARGFAIFLLATILSYFVLSDGHGLRGVNDGMQRAGFPLLFWERGGFAWRHSFSLLPFAADLAIAVVTGVVISILYRTMKREPLG